MNDKLGTALAKEACPVCGKAEYGPILINKRLTESEAKRVEELHGKVVGYMDEPCKKCQELMSKGFLFIGIVAAKTDDPNNPYRSGNKWVVSQDYANRVFDNNPPKEGVAFISVEIASKLGFPDINLDV